MLDGKRQSFVESAYRDTMVFRTIEDYHHYLKTHNVVDPEWVLCESRKLRTDRCSAIVVGCPPAYRGGTTKGTDLEIHLMKLFPKTAYFIEKVSLPA